jgi:uncharacterized protein (TIGR00730 family)
MKRVAVFCGSGVGNDPSYRQAARCLGLALVERDLELVFGGGHIGLMGVLADAVLYAGGKAHGVIPQSLVDKELAHAGLTHLHVVQTMHERKALMADLAHGFLALPGGYGTADELFEALTWAQLGFHSKPVGLLNVSGYFDGLLNWLQTATQAGFISRQCRSILIEDTQAGPILDRLLAWRPADPFSG